MGSLVVDALLELDADAMQGAAASARALAEHDASPSTRIRAELCGAWPAIIDARPLDDAPLHELEQRARSVGEAELVIEAAALRALAASELHDLERALASARRACRMARSEGLPRSEFLAGLVLARLRRQTGHAWLATHIIGALRRFATCSARRFVDWEQTLAAGPSHEALSGPAEHLRQVLVHARAGERVQFDAALARAQHDLAGLGMLQRDLAHVRAVLDPSSDASEPAIARWCTGELATDAPPLGLAGLNGDASDDSCTIAIARPGARGRRALHAGLGLALDYTGNRRLDGGHVGRREGIVSALVLAGPDGMGEDALFRAAYGFAYAPSIHRGTFDVALHRARELAEPFASIERHRGVIELRVREPFVVVDPRSTGPMVDRVLAALARAGKLPARELATSLGLPLRTVQHALRGYVESGLCQQRRDGRHIVYAIEDTTFQEPTLA